MLRDIESKSPMRGKGYYSLDICRNVGSKIEKTKEETYEQQIKRVNLIEKLYS